MSVFQTPKVNYNSSYGVGPGDLNRIELNLLKLITLQQLQGTFVQVSSDSNSFSDIATINISIPKAIVDTGLKLALAFNVEMWSPTNYLGEVRARIGSTYSATSKTGLIYFPAMVPTETITIVVQGHGNEDTEGLGYTTYFRKQDPQIRGYFSE